MKKLLLLLMGVVVAISANADITKVYIRGDMNGFEAQDAWELKSTDGVTYTKTGVSFTKDKQFKIGDSSWSSVNYGLGDNDNDCTVSVGYTNNIYSNKHNMKVNEDVVNAKFTFVIGSNGSATLKIENNYKEDSGTIPTPSNLFVVGKVNNNNWNPTNAVQLTEKKANGKAFILRNASFQDPYTFYFISGTGNWNATGANTYSTSHVGDLQLTKGTPVEITRYVENKIGASENNNDHNFKAANGTYDLVVDFSGATPTVAYYNPGETPYDVSTDKYYLWTNFRNSGTFKGYELNAANNYSYTLTFQGDESGTKAGIHINDSWRGANNTSEYAGTTKTYNMTTTSGGDIIFASKLTGDVTFKYDVTAKTLTVSGGEIHSVVDPTPAGTKYYIMGGYTAVQDTPMLLVPENEGRYQATIHCYHNDGWTSIILFAENEVDGKIERTYYGSNGKALEVGNPYNFTANTENRIDVSALDEENSYIVTFSPGYGWVTISLDDRDRNDYYLSGDINVWSDVTNRNTSSTSDKQEHGFFTGENDFFYLQDDPDNPWVRFKSKEEMNTKWKFEFVGPGPEGTDGDNWYRLNLNARGASDLNKHVGRLGGQFKIIRSNLTTTSAGFGITADTNDNGVFEDNELKTYWKKEIRVGEVFQGEEGGKQNFLLAPTVVENAVIWFNPTSKQVLVLGDPKDLYVYYANEHYAETHGPKVYVNTSSQYNNCPQVDPFREYNGSNQHVDATVDGYYDYSWEKYYGEDTDGDGVGDGVKYYPYGESVGATYTTFPFVWRKKIPASIIHRTPMAFLTSVRPAAAETANEDKWFPRVRIDCEDIWFVENEVNVYFRFADPLVQNSEATKVYFNAWLDQYDVNGSLIGNKYLYDSFAKAEMLKLEKDGQNSVLWSDIALDKQKDANGNYLTWFKAPVTLASDFANAGYAMFASCYGGFYPTKGAGASLADRESVALNGADLYYVVGGSSSRVGILYSHLKGTFAQGDAKVIQIGAEFFAKGHSVFRDNDLNTTIGSEVDYKFSVTDAEGNELLSDAEDWKDEPYYNWNVDGLPVGLYTVNVTVRKLVDGKYQMFSSNDIYPIFKSHNN